MDTLSKARIGIVGLGYVGLPLAVEFGTKYPTIGFDISEPRVRDLQKGIDRTLEIDRDELAAATFLSVTSDLKNLADCNVYVITVPTPIDTHKRPDLRPLESASRAIGSVLKKGDVVVYESTVYPAATEEVCVPILSSESGLVFNSDYYVGYSPERINPGDKEHRVSSILKVTSGSTPEVADYVDRLYSTIIKAGTYKASSIRVAEAAKVIENTQRDVNIALINELAHLFHRLDIDTEEVLKAAGTKWNFLPFRPGLVGGHCIGVDPYYLTFKAQEVGHLPEMILSGRRINDDMGAYVTKRLLKLLASRRIHIAGSNILILGLAFKENCPDIRNTRVVDVIKELQSFDANVDVFDPWVSAEDAASQYGVTLQNSPRPGHYDAVVLAVAHKQFTEMGAETLRGFGKPDSVLFDVKYALPADAVDGRL